MFVSSTGLEATKMQPYLSHSLVKLHSLTHNTFSVSICGIVQADFTFYSQNEEVDKTFEYK